MFALSVSAGPTAAELGRNLCFGLANGLRIYHQPTHAFCPAKLAHEQAQGAVSRVTPQSAQLPLLAPLCALHPTLSTRRSRGPPHRARKAGHKEPVRPVPLGARAHELLGPREQRQAAPGPGGEGVLCGGVEGVCWAYRLGCTGSQHSSSNLSLSCQDSVLPLSGTRTHRGVSRAGCEAATRSSTNPPTSSSSPASAACSRTAITTCAKGPGQVARVVRWPNLAPICTGSSAGLKQGQGAPHEYDAPLALSWVPRGQVGGSPCPVAAHTHLLVLLLVNGARGVHEALQRGEGQRVAQRAHLRQAGSRRSAAACKEQRKGRWLKPGASGKDSAWRSAHTCGRLGPAF